jgi:hypothetical protein
VFGQEVGHCAGAAGPRSAGALGNVMSHPRSGANVVITISAIFTKFLLKIGF